MTRVGTVDVCANPKCGRRFIVNTFDHSYCSINCRRRDRYGAKFLIGEERVCSRDGCEQTYTVRGSAHKYCSETCRPTGGRTPLHHQSTDLGAPVPLAIEYAIREADRIRHRGPWASWGAIAYIMETYHGVYRAPGTWAMLVKRIDPSAGRPRGVPYNGIDSVRGRAA